jgi:hypothetical protein
MFRGGKHGQNGGTLAVAVNTPSAAEHALTILTQHTEVTSPARSE